MSRTPDTAPPPRAAPPPRGPGLGRLFVWLALVAVIFTAGVLSATAIRRGTARAWQAVFAAQPQAQTSRYYTCGMHPWIVLPQPGLCPICHMDLTPIDPDKFTGEVTIDPVVSQNIGIRVDPVVSGPVVQTIRTVGTVDYDETGVRDVNTKVSGWIEKLHVDYLGAEVEAGEPLFDIYSPQLYEAQEEYLLEYRKTAAPAAAAGDLLEATRTRLEYYDITPAQIRALEERGEPSKTMTITSPHRGIVIAKHANEGMRVTEGMQVYRIADLSKVWVMATLYEYQLPLVQAGQRAVISLPYIPGQTFEGRIIYIYPYLDETTRQVNVRLEFDNPGMLLKPGMYASVELSSTLAGQRALAPRSAILDTGHRQVAFVSLGNGSFQPRDVRVGVQTAGGMVEILDGLKPGEMVVTSGQFLLDSEARVRDALAKMVRGTPATGPAAAEVPGPTELSALPAEAEASLAGLLDAYFAVGKALSGDTTEGIADEARLVAARTDDLLRIDMPQDLHFWHTHEEAAIIRAKALELVERPDLVDARLQFADLSVALSKLLRATGVPPGYPVPVQELHCPMYREGQGGSIWLQPDGSPRNPFIGSLMLRCFDERRTLPVTGGAPQ